jgi:hypothetical protein
MGLKQHSERASVAPPSDPAWGRLAVKGETAPVVRFAVGDRSVSFPLHGLTRWELQPGPTDTLTIRAADETVTVRGNGLAVVRDALDEGSLLLLRVKPGRFPAAPAGETIVTGITFEAKAPTRAADSDR